MHKSCVGDSHHNETVFVPLAEVHMPQKTWDRILRKDHGQIEKMRAAFENGDVMVRVVLRPGFGGGYNIEDGRHRVMAAKLDEERFVEALQVKDKSVIWLSTEQAWERGPINGVLSEPAITIRMPASKE
jgi:hypothetical protein